MSERSVNWASDVVPIVFLILVFVLAWVYVPA
jgi:hypothetical protein